MHKEPSIVNNNTEPLSSLIEEEDVRHLTDALPLLPICTITDLANIERAKRGFHPNFSPHTPQNESGYAWQRHPRYVAEYEIAVERFIKNNPFQAILWVDEASSITLLKSSMQATWLRDLGDVVQRSFNEDLFSSFPKTPEYSYLKQTISPKESKIRRALASYAQIALYTIPLGMSRKPVEIRRYLTSSVAFMCAFSRHRLRTGHERRQELYGDSNITKAFSSMEERWRIDTTFCDNPGDCTLLDILSEEEFSFLGPGLSKEVAESFEIAKVAEQEGDKDLAEEIRADARTKIQEGKITKVVGKNTSADYLARLSIALADSFIEQGVASPAAFYSIDMAPPEELVRRARATLDIETLASGVYRRAEESLLRGDPTHITANVSEGRRYFPDGSIMFLGNFEGTDFYRELPSSLKDFSQKVKEATEDFKERVVKLHKGGVCASFPWDIIDTEEEQASMADPERSKYFARIRSRFLDRVFRNIQAFEEGEAVQKWHTLSEVMSWMTPEEADHLVRFSPVFKKYRNSDPDTTKIPVLIFTKNV